MSEPSENDFCSAEFRTCEGGSGSGSGPDDGGFSFGRQPGTGCNPSSNDFRDRDNWRMAQWAVTAYEVCESDLEGTARIIVAAPQTDADEWRLESIECSWPQGVVDTIRLPTTMACYNLAWDR